MSDFVDNVNAKSIVLHVKTQSLKMDLLKTFQTFNKQGKYVIVDNSDKKNCSLSPQNVEVHFIMLEVQTSVDYLSSCLKNRENYKKETWILYVKVKYVKKFGMSYTLSNCSQILVNVQLNGSNLIFHSSQRLCTAIIRKDYS